MITISKKIDDVEYIYVNGGSRRVLIVDDPAHCVYARVEWLHDYARAKKNVDYYLSELLAGNLSAYYLTEAFIKWFKVLLSGGSFTGPDAYARQIPELQTMVKSPLDPEYSTTLQQMIIQLNDYHYWTREKIADWLETLDVNPILNKS